MRCLSVGSHYTTQARRIVSETQRVIWDCFLVLPCLIVKVTGKPQKPGKAGLKTQTLLWVKVWIPLVGNELQPAEFLAEDGENVMWTGKWKNEEIGTIDSLMTKHRNNGSSVCVRVCALTLCDPTDCSPPGSSVHGIFQARILEWVAISYSRGSLIPGSPALQTHSLPSEPPGKFFFNKKFKSVFKITI